MRTGATDAAGNVDSQVCVSARVLFREYKSCVKNSDFPLSGIMIKVGLVLLFAAYGESRA